MDKKNRFVAKFPENADLNQYWYSPHTIEVMVAEIANSSKRAAFLSTPSLYYSLDKKSEVRAASWVFDLDPLFGKTCPNHFEYDFNKPLEFPEELRGSFDCVVVDPPFITEEVWAKYTETVKALLAPEGKIICTTISENRDFMERLLGVKPNPFKPSIPHLVYQYELYTNYPAEHFQEKNPEIPDDD